LTLFVANRDNSSLTISWPWHYRIDPDARKAGGASDRPGRCGI